MCNPKQLEAWIAPIAALIIAALQLSKEQLLGPRDGGAALRLGPVLLRNMRGAARRCRAAPKSGLPADKKHDDGEDALEQTRAGSRGWRRRICGGVHRWTRGSARDRAGTAGRPAQHRDGRWRRVREHRVLHSQRSSPPARLSPLLCIAHGAKSRLCAHNPCFERRDDALDRVHAPRRRSSTAFLELLQRQRAVPRGNGLT